MTRYVLAVIMMIVMSMQCLPALAVDPDVILKDPVLESRARNITRQLRCPTCVSQSVDSSNVGISRDLQVLVRERVIAGDTDLQILDYVASRYGEFVLLRPRVSGQNALLWAMPFLMFAGAIISGVLYIRRHRTRPSVDGQSANIADNQPPQPCLTDDEKRQLSTLVD